MGLAKARIRISRTISWVDVFLFIGIVFFLYAMVGVVQDWVSPYRPTVEIKLDLFSLAKYSFFSLVRVTAAYALSLLFTFTYGYIAAKSRVAEPILIPLLDIFQSIPVLGFMPVFVLALVRLFPHSNLGLELAAVIMIFTGQGWNMVFSFYSSLKAVPQELRDMAALCHMRKRELLKNVEIPFAMNGLLWNSMLSMAGGWFFLMTIESFTLGDQSFRLPGIGSYMAVAYSAKDMGAVAAGIFAMFSLILLVDRCVWAPLVIWSERFKMESSQSESQTSFVLEFLKKSNLMEKYFESKAKFQKKLERRLEVARKKVPGTKSSHFRWAAVLKVAKWTFVVMGAGMLFWGGLKAREILSATALSTWLVLLRDLFFTFLRVTLAVVLGSLWTVPVGVFIGTNPKWTNRLQPVVQVVASFPAPMLFPMIIWLLDALGIGIEFGATILMLFASQWYILFNVISGATRIPKEMIDLAGVFRLKGVAQWKAILFPAIFPSLVNGWITATGGAWNASIVAEYLKVDDRMLVATGIGAAITKAAETADFPALASGVLIMVTIVVLLNRFFWNNLYRLAETRYRME